MSKRKFNDNENGFPIFPLTIISTLNKYLSTVTEVLIFCLKGKNKNELNRM